MIRFLAAFFLLFANPALSATYIFSFKSNDLVATGEWLGEDRNVPITAALLLKLDSLSNVDFSMRIDNNPYYRTWPYFTEGRATITDSRFVDAWFTNLTWSRSPSLPLLHWDVAMFSNFAIKTDALGNLIHASFSSHFDTPDLRITDNNVNWGGSATEFYRGTGTWTVVAAIPLPPTLPLLGSALLLGFGAMRLSARRRRSVALAGQGG